MSPLARTLLAGAAGLAVTAATPAFVPTGAKIEASGFATIERAPHVPYPDAPPPADNNPGAEAEWYARDQGISVAEARQRQAEQQAMFNEFHLLVENLRAREAGNFTAARMIHKPDWGYELYFKRDPERTLAKYTQNPRFTAKLARYSREELEALIKPWTERFTAEKITGGWGVDDTHGTANIMMAVTEAEFRAISAREGWGAVPEAIKLEFATPLGHPSVEEQAKPFIRAFAQESRSTVIQLLALGMGRIVMRDGCLRLGSRPDSPLVMFHRETGIGIDEQGYLALKDRATGKSKGRIGEWFSWGGPNGTSDEEPSVIELKKRCGNAPIANVGNPESHATFRARPNVIATVATQRGVSRERAWEILKRCWARQEEARPNHPPDEICSR